MLTFLYSGPSIYADVFSAYIAASRRSDRSLEARMESARRASEIHKRRTGRSLRVTEQDVENEEIYEEENDDLPVLCRQITANAHTSTVDFPKRLSACFTNHIDVRNALEHAVALSYATQYPPTPPFAYNQTLYQPSVTYADRPQQQAPSLYHPHPNPVGPGGLSLHQERSAAESLPLSSRSFSPSSPGTQSPPCHMQLSQPSPRSSVKQEDNADQTRASHYLFQQPQQQQQPFQNINGHPNISSFTTSLPTESEILFRHALSPNDLKTVTPVAESELSRQL